MRAQCTWCELADAEFEAWRRALHQLLQPQVGNSAMVISFLSKRVQLWKRSSLLTFAAFRTAVVDAIGRLRDDFAACLLAGKLACLLDDLMELRIRSLVW